MKSLDPRCGDVAQDMAKAHTYTMQLEKQLRELMTSQGNDLEKSLSSSQQSLEASNAEVDRLKIEFAQIQAKLTSSQNDLEKNRQELQQKKEELINKSETFRIRELELTSELQAIKKSHNDLEVFKHSNTCFEYQI